MAKINTLCLLGISIFVFLSCENRQSHGGGLGNLRADTSYITRKYIGIPYGSVYETQKLDIYLPDEQYQPPYPVIIACHGGAFLIGSSDGKDVEGMISSVKQGYAVVSVNYRLANEAIFPAAVNDMKAAVRWVRANAQKYHFDSEKIIAWGDSAGGNLVAMLGTTGELPYVGKNDNPENLEYSSAVQAVVAWFGSMDFLSMDKQFEESGIKRMLPSWVNSKKIEEYPESRYIGQALNLDPQLTKQTDPATYIQNMDIAHAPSFFFQHGTDDNLVPVQQSIVLANLLRTKLGEDKVEIDLIHAAGHGTSEFNTKENLDKVFAFLNKVFKK